MSRKSASGNKTRQRHARARPIAKPPISLPHRKSTTRSITTSPHRMSLRASNPAFLVRITTQPVKSLAMRAIIETHPFHRKATAGEGRAKNFRHTPMSGRNRTSMRKLPANRLNSVVRKLTGHGKKSIVSVKRNAAKRLTESRRKSKNANNLISAW